MLNNENVVEAVQSKFKVIWIDMELLFTSDGNDVSKLWYSRIKEKLSLYAAFDGVVLVVSSIFALLINLFIYFFLSF
jgi:hypothetical protein